MIFWNSPGWDMFSRLPGRVRTVLFHGKSSPLEGSLDGTEPWEPGPIVDQTPEVPLVLFKVWANPFGGLKYQNNGSSQVPGLVQASQKRSLPVWGLGNAWWVISNSCIFPVFLAFHLHPIAPVGSKMTVVASGSHSWWMLVFCIIEDWRHWKPTTVV